MMLIVSTGIRITTPSSRISIRSSLPSTTFRQTSFPVFSVMFIAIIPLPARDWLRYASSGVRLPMPFSVIAIMQESFTTGHISTTRSSSSSLMARTPAAFLPIARTSCSLKRMLMPFAVPMMNSSSPAESATEISSSPSRRFWAIMPPLRMFENSETWVFLIMPFLVQSTR